LTSLQDQPVQPGRKEIEVHREQGGRPDYKDSKEYEENGEQLAQRVQLDLLEQVVVARARARP
jgi:hypothetical protein